MASTSGDRIIRDRNSEDDHYFQLQSKLSRVQLEKGALEKAHQTLLDNHSSLQSHLDDVLSERDDAFARIRELSHEADTRGSGETDAIMKAEVDRLRAELQKSEANLAVTESELEKQKTAVAGLTHRVDELQDYAAEAARFKDEVDELRQASAEMEDRMKHIRTSVQAMLDVRKNFRPGEAMIRSFLSRISAERTSSAAADVGDISPPATNVS